MRLETADGLAGLGYACTYAGPEAGALRVLIDELAVLVKGEDARFRGRIVQTLRRALASAGEWVMGEAPGLGLTRATGVG